MPPAPDHPLGPQEPEAGAQDPLIGSRSGDPGASSSSSGGGGAQSEERPLPRQQHTEEQPQGGPAWLQRLRRAFSLGPAAPEPQRVPCDDVDEEAGSSSGSAPGSQEGDGELSPAGAEAGTAPERSASGEIGPSGSPKLGRAGSRSNEKVCLICLEALTPEDFETGRAMALACQCRGDLALRHRECAIKWAQVKGSNVCELCKAPVTNLPALPPRPPAAQDLEDQYMSGDIQALIDLTPSYADLVFDCIRVTWIAMIVSILFFSMNLGAAVWTGLIAGLAYSCMVRLMYKQHFAAMQRLHEQQQAAMAAAQGGGAPAGGTAPAAQQLRVVVVGGP